MALPRPLTRFIAVDRENFTLDLYKRAPLTLTPKRVARYKIAVGAAGYETPRGLFVVTARAKNPEWRMPNSDWVKPEDRGKVIPGGDPANPIKARFLKLTEDGVGIHGTAADHSIGTAASHGCIRMHVDDVIELYPLVPLYTPVYIV